jgi:small subunit ribosomal protein S9
MATSTNNYFYALGRRKSATARVRLTNKKGEFIVNGKSANEYFAGSKFLLNDLMQSFNVLELDPENFTVSVKVSGGGHASQVDAIRLGIAKALTEINEDFRVRLGALNYLVVIQEKKNARSSALRVRANSASLQSVKILTFILDNPCVWV